MKIWQIAIIVVREVRLPRLLQSLAVTGGGYHKKQSGITFANVSESYRHLYVKADAIFGVFKPDLTAQMLHDDSF